MAPEASLEALEDWEEWNPESGTSFVVHAAAGSLAGAAEHCAMYPVDTIKTYSQAEGSSGFRAVQQVLKVEGIFRLWRGVSTMLTGCVPAHAAYFSIYEHCKVVLGVDQQDHRPLSAAACGAFATVAHDSIMTPMDVIKQRLQLGFHNGVIDCARSVVASNGVKALFISFPTTLLMNIPYAGIMVATNESVKKIINPSNEYNLKAFIVSGAIAGAVAAVATNPMDVIKTRLQTQTILSQQRMGKAQASGHYATIPRSVNKSVEVFRAGSGGARLSLVSNNFVSNTGIDITNLSFCRFKYIGRRLFDPTLRKGTTTCTNTNYLEGSRKTSRTVHSKATPDSLRYRGLFSAVRTIYKEEGIFGFARGMRARLLVNAPSVAISWATYESAKTLLAESLSN